MQKKTCTWEGFDTAFVQDWREWVDFDEIEYGSDVAWHVSKTKKVKSIKIWNGKKNVTQENAVKVYFGVGYRYTWDDIATVYKEYGTMHVLKHKYWALTKSSMEECEKASR